MKFAERIHDKRDVHIASGLTAEQWANGNANGIIGDDTTDAPNVNYLNLSSAPPPNQWQDASTMQPYTGEVVGYVGSKPDDR